MAARIAIFGGSFDPVHRGHVEVGKALLAQLDLQAIHFLPCAIHAHKAALQFNDQARVDMLKLALADQAGLVLDLRELVRSGVSYTIDSCREVRDEFGREASIGLVIGDDLLPTLHRWKDWQLLLDYVNLVVINRAQDSLDENGDDALHKSSDPAPRDAAVGGLMVNSVPRMTRPAGDVVTLNLTERQVSSTAVRRILSSNELTSSEKADALAERLDSRVIQYLQANHYIN